MRSALKSFETPKTIAAAQVDARPQWGDLPPDLLQAIVQRLAVRAPLRLVCKTWCRNLSNPVEQISTVKWDSSFAVSFPNLKILEFRRNSSGGLGDLSTLTRLNHLCLLDLSHQLGVDDHALLSAGKLTKLIVLKLNNCPNISDVGLTNLTLGPLRFSLRQLDLSFCQGITDDGVANLGATMGSLSHMTLKFCINVEGWGVHGFIDSTASLLGLDLSYKTKLRQFRELTRHKESNFSAHPFRKFSHPVEGLTTLKVLNLSFGDVTDDLVAGVASHLTNINSLNLASCHMVSSKGFNPLGNMRKLEYLNLSDNRLTDRTIEHFHALENLQKLNISFCTHVKGESPSFIDVLINLPKLQLLEANLCRYTLLEKLQCISKIRFQIFCEPHPLGNQCDRRGNALDCRQMSRICSSTCKD